MTALRHLRVSPTPDDPRLYEIDDAGPGDWYYEIPSELASAYLAAQAEADRLHMQILRHIHERHLQEQPPEDGPTS